jgi:hypothetical protein
MFTGRRSNGLRDKSAGYGIEGKSDLENETKPPSHKGGEACLKKHSIPRVNLNEAV